MKHLPTWLIIVLLILLGICSLPILTTTFFLTQPRINAAMGFAPTPTPNTMGTPEQAIEFVKKWTPIGYETVPIGEAIASGERDKLNGTKTIGWNAIRDPNDEGWRVQWHRTVWGQPTYSEWWYSPKEKKVIPLVRAW